jgi:hypothetical protein
MSVERPMHRQLPLGVVSTSKVKKGEGETGDCTVLLDFIALWPMVLQAHDFLTLNVFSRTARNTVLFIIGRRARREAVRFTRSQHPRR